MRRRSHFLMLRVFSPLSPKTSAKSVSFKMPVNRADVPEERGQKLRNQRLFVLNAFGADRRRKSDSVFRINTPRVRNIKIHASGYDRGESA
jgi:hypothetical protein